MIKDNVSVRNIPKLPMHKAAAYVVAMGIETLVEFKKRCKTGEVPYTIPRDLARYYEDFESWPAFLEEGKRYLLSNEIPCPDIQDYNTLKSKLDKQCISTQVAYKNAVQSGKLGQMVPLRPDVVYSEFTSWQSFLAKPDQSRFLPFEDARDKVISLGVKTSTQWLNLCRSGKRPKDVPFWPSEHYTEWQGWKHFLNK